MTAYGRACVVSSIGRFVTEIQSVNRKHLEINTLLPKELLRFDTDVKRWIASVIYRGQLYVKIFVCLDQSSPLVVRPNLPLARQIKAAWDIIAKDLGMESGFTLEMLTHESEILLYDEDLQDEHLYKQALQESVTLALERLLRMKKEEGKALHADIVTRLEKLEKWIQSIAVKIPDATTRYRRKLMERLEEVLGKSIENEERILREVSLYAERIDIAEEITRFDSHLKQFSDLLDKETQGIGKTLEFLVQELNREANTISSKSSDITVSHLVVEIKSELERIREQIQNIE
jgi:uncharacterized protein (TIGR00255 family)